MRTAYLLVALGGGVVVFLALLTISFPQVLGQRRSTSTRAEAARAWPGVADGSGKKRVLVVERSGKEQRAVEDRLRAAGYAVISCVGPEGSPETFPYGGCLILNDGRCSLSSGADAIVFGLDLDYGAARALLREYGSTHTPMVVRSSDRQAEWYADLLRDFQVTRSATDESLVRAVGEALGGSPSKGSEMPSSQPQPVREGEAS